MKAEAENHRWISPSDKLMIKSLKLLATLTLFGVMFLLFPKTAKAVSCSVAPTDTLVIISSSCSFDSTANGVPGELRITAGTLTISDAQTITATSMTFPVSSTGSTVTVGSGQYKPGLNIYMIDADGDHYAATTTQYAQATAPTNGVLRSTITSLTTTDCYDNNPNAKPGQTTAYAYSRGSTSAGALVADGSADGLSFDFDCNSATTKFRTTVDTPACANSCSIAQHPLTDVSGEATACGTTGINAGYASVVTNTDVYGACTSCTGSGSVTTTMVCK